MRLSGFNLIDRWNEEEADEIKKLFERNPKAVVEVYIHAPAEKGLDVKQEKFTLKKDKIIVYSFDFVNRVYVWKNEEIYLTRHEEVALYAHLKGADIYWGVALRTIRQRLGLGFMADEKELEVGCKICDR